MAITAKAIKQSPKSVTAWLGAAVLLITYLGGAPSALEPLVSAAFMEAFVRIAGFVIGGAVIVNRFFTDDTLEAKAEQ